MKNTLYIYYNQERSCVQVVRPSAEFLTKSPAWGSLVEGITSSDHSKGIRRYHSYEVK